MRSFAYAQDDSKLAPCPPACSKTPRSTSRPAFGDVDLFSADRPLADAAARAGLDLAGLSACGKDYGAADTLDLGRVANENPPKLHIMDGKGNRIDFVEFHPAYHAHDGQEHRPRHPCLGA